MPLFGRTALGGTDDQNRNDYKMGSYFAIPTSGYALSITCRAKNNAAGVISSLRYGIYTDVAGVPTVLLGSTDPVVLGDAYQWLTKYFHKPIRLIKGTYWLTLLTGNQFCLVDSLTPSNNSKYNADAYADGFAQPFGVASTEPYQYCIYCTYSNLTQMRLRRRVFDIAMSRTVGTGKAGLKRRPIP